VNPHLRFREPEILHAIAHAIYSLKTDRELRFMEVCGGHTEAIYRYALRDHLPEWINLTSGPGCPVCVTTNGFIDHAIALARLPEVTLATFGDLVRVPGSSRSLAQVRAETGDVRIFYSPMDSLVWAEQHPERTVVFLGIGFETTACTIAATMTACSRKRLSNFRLLSAVKTMPRALETLLSAPDVHIDGLILPGHLTTVIGPEPFRFIADRFAIPCVVSGFEPVDLMETVLMLCRQIKDGRAEVENQYRRVVHPGGNSHAAGFIATVFRPCDMEWRGLGIIPASGLTLAERFSRWDAADLPVQVEPTRENPACRCGDILRGACLPSECPLYAQVCTPEDPRGACMVSSEGACAAAYHFAPVADER